MDPKKNVLDYDLDAPDLEIFSNTANPAKPSKKTNWHDLLSKSVVKTSLTLSLLLFLFGSTFFIASRVKKASFTKRPQMSDIFRQLKLKSLNQLVLNLVPK